MVGLGRIAKKQRWWWSKGSRSKRYLGYEERENVLLTLLLSAREFHQMCEIELKKYTTKSECHFRNENIKLIFLRPEKLERERKVFVLFCDLLSYPMRISDLQGKVRRHKRRAKQKSVVTLDWGRGRLNIYSTVVFHQCELKMISHTLLKSLITIPCGWERERERSRLRMTKKNEIQFFALNILLSARWNMNLDTEGENNAASFRLNGIMFQISLRLLTAVECSTQFVLLRGDAKEFHSALNFQDSLFSILSIFHCCKTSIV